MLRTDFLHHGLDDDELVTGQLREEVVFYLILQAAVEPVFVGLDFNVPAGLTL